MISGAILSQQLLEQNEDVLGAIIENLQLGRLEDCGKHFGLLKSNLISLALELDNFLPTVNETFPQTAEAFPDEIMRKDVLEDFLPPEKRILPTPPPIKRCSQCEDEQKSAEYCRNIQRHTEPCAQFTAQERDEFLKTTEVLAARHQQNELNAENGKSKRSYRRWTNHELFNLLIGINIFGTKNIAKLTSVLEKRTENQIRRYLFKNFNSSTVIKPLHELLANPPNGYQPPRSLAYIFANPTQEIQRLGMHILPASGTGPMSVNADAWCSPKKRDNDGVSSSFQQTTKCLHRRKQNDPLNCGAKSVQYLGQDEHFPAVSALTPKFGRDWTTLVTLAAGVQEIPFCDQSSKGSPSLQRQNELAAAVASATSVDIATSSPEPNTVFTIAHHNSMHSVAFSALDFTSHSALGHLLVDDSHPATSDSANFNQTKPLLTVPIPLPYSGEEKSRGPSVRPLKNVAGEKRKDSPTFNATGGEKQPRTSAFAHIFPSSSSATSVLAANILPAEGFEMDSNLILPHEANRAVRAEDFCLNTTDFTSLF